MRLLTTTEVAARLGVIPRRVRQLIAEGRIKARKNGRDWLISEAEVRRFAAKPRRPGPRAKAGQG
jgi:excisionase family DNA binding protein